MLQRVLGAAAMATVMALATATRTPPFPTVDDLGPAGSFVANRTAQHGAALAQAQSRARRGEDAAATARYSWGAPKLYTTPFTQDRASNLGGKTLLVVRFKVAGQACTGGCKAADVDAVISDAEIKEITDFGDAFIRANSYGKAWIEKVTVVPVTLEIAVGHFYQIVDRVREKAHAAGYDFADYDFDTHWKRSTDGEGMGGSAVPGGRAQTYK